MIEQLNLVHGTLELPAFLPDATQGVVRAADAQDVLATGTQALQMNVFHLMQHPGSSTIQALGGLHKMSGWPGPIFTDSGGFQVYSLLRQNARLGSINERGATFQLEAGGRRYKLTPEKSVQLQLSYGTDVVICLDDCTHVDAPLAEQHLSVQRTIQWASRCREEFDRLGRDKDWVEGQRPLLVAVIQGGASSELRRECAGALLEIGFDGYGYGGWPLDAQGNLLEDMLSLTRELVPPAYTVHALGVGHPASIVTCARMGYELFDSTMPTRDARHGRLYVFDADPAQARLVGDRWFHYLYVGDKKHLKDSQTLSANCDCLTCTQYSLGYLHHLYKIGDHLLPRLATIHNLRFMSRLMTNLRTFA